MLGRNQAHQTCVHTATHRQLLQVGHSTSARYANKCKACKASTLMGRNIQSMRGLGGVVTIVFFKAKRMPGGMRPSTVHLP